RTGIPGRVLRGVPRLAHRGPQGGSDLLLPMNRTFTLRLEARADHLVSHGVAWRRGIAQRPLPRHLARLQWQDWRPWVDELVASSGEIRRVRLVGYKDYSEANAVGSRGIYYYYHLREGRVYEIREIVG